MRAICMAVAGLIAIPAAHAADVTELPTALRGDVAVTYGGDLFAAPLVENGRRVGSSSRGQHDVRLDLAFAPTAGIAVTAGLEFAAARSVSFGEDSNSIAYDPVTDSGSFSDGTPLTDLPSFSASGLKGIWVGVAVGPYGRWMKAEDKFSWRLDVSARLGGGATFFEGADTRGAAPGGTAFRIAGSFAREAGFAEAYVTAAYQYESRATVDIGDEVNGLTLASASVQDPSRLDTRFGAELITLEDREKGLRVAIDIYGRVGWRSSARVASGVYLPSVLDRSRGIEIWQSEALYAGAGLGLIIRPAKVIGFRVSGDISAWTPFTVEHVYDVQYGAGARSIGINAAITGRWR